MSRVKITVGNLTFNVRKMKASTGLPLLARIAGLINRAKNTGELDTDLLMVLTWKMAKFSEWVTPDGAILPLDTVNEEGDRAVFDNCFDDDYTSILMWFAECGEVHFKRFLGTLGVSEPLPVIVVAALAELRPSPSNGESGTDGESSQQASSAKH